MSAWKILAIWATSVLFYLTCGFLTYGYVDARRNPERGEAQLAFAFWPLYWFGRGWIATADASVNLFKDPPPLKVER